MNNATWYNEKLNDTNYRIDIALKRIERSLDSALLARKNTLSINLTINNIEDLGHTLLELFQQNGFIARLEYKNRHETRPRLPIKNECWLSFSF